ncbi:DUF262 domain-containing protein [Myroides odoratimimus]|uniref:DUF262 domain-containing protein n=1 Tax=Myroides odoratimimus TaxID=76832 RepID=UPI002578B928|nr:DUF262 domain-containing HNH endonuclease family protein [Myroides odoratimimus]MDM1465252.1 DUF262 domain-containing protein [Myroides odoratimimus]MDM1475256.1 DUF262 domain-containing protein [Myroides odoratimimus]
MEITAPHDSIGNFFESKPIYTVPKYQRAYAWEIEEINDFIKDLENCFNKRVANSETDHFFGGIVCVVHKVLGSRNALSYELVDGQQRLATVVLLVSSMLDVYNELKDLAIQNNDDLNERIIKDRINEWTSRFIQFNLEVNRHSTVYNVLTLSGADELFFRNLILGLNPTASRDSHKRIQLAKTKLLEKIKALTSGGNLEDRMDKVEIIQQLIDVDFSIIRIETDNKDNAYRLFQVLNNRGKNLTEGDLLRARTLELLEGNTALQASAVDCWDDILADSPNVTSNFLRYIYASHVGTNPGSRTLYDDFLAKFFPDNIKETLTPTEASRLHDQVKILKEEINICRKLSQGIWPFPHSNPILAWNRSRLDMLINSLGHTLSMPLLLSASKLSHVVFSELVQLIERFAFRFVIISGQHPSKLGRIYLEESVAIRVSSVTYDIKTLYDKLKNLQDSLATESIFISNLEALMYQKGGGNKPIKYFLITVENYLRWYQGGATGTPICNDGSFFFNFNDTTIEHIYPRNAPTSDIVATMEPLKNTLGNLTIMGPSDNGKGSNDNFQMKKHLFLASSVLMNREIGGKTKWEEVEIESNLNFLKDIARAIFTLT